MKHEVLDDGFIKDWRWSLEPQEKIIWEGQPHVRLFNPFKGAGFEDLFSIALLGSGFLIFIMPLIYYSISSGGFSRYLILSIIGIFLYTRGLLFLKRKKTKYTITSQRIIFQLWKIGKGETLDEIPFSKINNIVITEEGANNGVIFLGIKNPNSILFETEHIIDGNKRHQPTLEFINDVKEVGQYIQLGIQGKL